MPSESGKILKLDGKKTPTKYSFLDDILGNVPELEEMDPEALCAYYGSLENALEKLDTMEPKNENSEAYDTWAEYHEDLEDLMDEVQDYLDDLS